MALNCMLSLTQVAEVTCPRKAPNMTLILERTKDGSYVWASFIKDARFCVSMASMHPRPLSCWSLSAAVSKPICLICATIQQMSSICCLAHSSQAPVMLRPRTRNHKQKRMKCGYAELFHPLDHRVDTDLDVANSAFPAYLLSRPCSRWPGREIF